MAKHGEQPKREWFSAKAVDRVGDVYIFDEIGFWGTDAKTFMTRWKAIAKEVDRFELRINSPGGDVMAASGIYNVIASEKKPVDVYIVGFALSAASWIAMAGKTVHMASNGVMMLHNPNAVTVGDAQAHEKTIEILGKVKAAMVTNYAAKSGKSIDEVNAILDEETWYTAEEALAEGFVDEVIQAEDMQQAAACFSLDLGNYKHIPKGFAAKFRAMSRPEETPQGAAETEIDAMNDQNWGELTLDGVRAKRPDLIEASTKVGYESGVKAERDRISQIRAAAFDGQDELVKKLVDEGTDVTASVVSLNQDWKARGTQALNALESETEATPIVAINTPKAPENTEEKTVQQADLVATFKHQFIASGKDEATAERMAKRAAGM